jgi:DNA-binding transcriptional MerR regulator
MYSVSQLAHRCGLSRSTGRTPGNYRSYSENDFRRLARICIYRDAGLRLGDIRAILTGPDNDASAVLQRRLVEISGEIERSRNHQKAILKLLKHKNSFRRMKVITTEVAQAFLPVWFLIGSAVFPNDTGKNACATCENGG